MAMILEILDAAGSVRARVRPGDQPLTIGRALDNDIVLDDAYVDAHHARVETDAAGAITLEDLDSTNQLGVLGRSGRVSRVALAPGMELRIGRTRVRVRDSAEPVPPALRDAALPVELPAAAWQSTRVRLVVSAAAVAAFAGWAWLASTERSAASETLGGALGFAVLAALWAGIWAIAGRVVVQRFHFLGHFAVISAVTLVAIPIGFVQGWADFLWPDNPVGTPLGLLASGLLAVAMLTAHLALASRLGARRRWQVSGLVVGLIFMLGLAAVLAEDDGFSDVPEYSGVIRPLAARWVPAIAPAQFGMGAAALQQAVDELRED